MIEETFDDGSVSVFGCVTKSPANILSRDIIAMIEEACPPSEAQTRATLTS
jgi:hypothetical protein